MTTGRLTVAAGLLAVLTAAQLGGAGIAVGAAGLAIVTGLVVWWIRREARR